MAKSKQTAVKHGELLPEDNAVLEGADVPAEEPLAKIPVSRSELYHRLDEYCRREQGSALLAVRYASPNPFEEAHYEIYEAEMRDNGRVKLVDIVKRSRDLGILGETESPIPNW
jgi:hypothetical protein